ncbi:ATP-binding protein [Pseudomonas fontis]|uniref:histidine kinase n=1 Tax=Pseudomonas fontis TaxID=2942633 RepID=A0ABT5P0M0_9PSED|nr:ATP-binding protein [Pseudomonas fontis]MDD0976981.1 ATP-binding protein [Pseudomonas fontis]MDD0994003.1 ATP-binding protein [Pseudomonas fontis]
MNDSLANGERALILAPPPLSSLTHALLDKAGISALATSTLVELGQALDQGAGLAIIAHESLDGFAESSLKHYLSTQPDWSDLPVVLLTATPCSDPACAALHAELGNLYLLQCPFLPQGLLTLTQSSLRARRRQYQARSQAMEQLHVQQALEEQLRHLREDEQRLRHTEKMEAIGQLAGGVAHDFNNMLTGIGGSLELINRRLAQGRQQDLPKLIDLSLSAVHRAASMTHQLLAFSSRQSLNATPVSLARLLDRERLSALLSPQITLHIELEDDLWLARADTQQLQETLDNLLGNARDAMPNGGELRIHAGNRHLGKSVPGGHPLASGDYLQLSLSDNGCGMPQSSVDRAFDPFFTTKPIGKGTGLGLSMVYGFIRQSQGHVTLHSKIGQGTSVELFLPRFNNDPQPDAQSPVADQHPASSRVLIVEDDATVRLLVRETLEEQGYACKEVADATLALPLLRAPERIDLLISDVGLPGMNGRQLAEIARTLRPGLKVLFITGYAENATARMSFLDPGMQMISKPFSFSQLASKVAQMLAEDGGP